MPFFRDFSKEQRRNPMLLHETRRQRTKIYGKKGVDVSEVRTLLVRFFRLGDHYSLIPRDSLGEIFTAVFVNDPWNYEHCYPVQKLVQELVPSRRNGHDDNIQWTPHRFLLSHQAYQVLL